MYKIEQKVGVYMSWPKNTQTRVGRILLIYFTHSLPLFSLSLCSRPNPNKGGRPAISAYCWADYIHPGAAGCNDDHGPYCHRQPIFIEQSETILAGPREATHLPTWRYFLSTRPQGLHLMHKAGLSTRHKAPRRSFLCNGFANS